MLRFVMPEDAQKALQRKEAVLSQLDDLMHSKALQDMLKIIDSDIDTIGQTYNGRMRLNGSVVESQEMSPSTFLNEKREELYPLFKELGFFDINKPVNDRHSRIVVLGGSVNACNERTEYAKRWIDDTTIYVDGLACYRPVGSTERKKAPVCHSDTEFGAMTESFVRVFGLNQTEFTEDFRSDRNLNAVSCIRDFGRSDDREYRIFAAPSSQPDQRRADTGDTLSFYFEHEKPTDREDSALFITNNRHCNRQFLQLAYCMVQNGQRGKMDVIGCYPDDRITTVDEYDPFLYLQDLIGIIDWMHRFKELV